MTTSTTTDRTGSALPHARNWLALAASPTFAFMTWGATGDAAVLCSPDPGMLQFGGMGTMYLLMSLFHLPAWLKLGADRRRTHDQPITTGD